MLVKHFKHFQEKVRGTMSSNHPLPPPHTHTHPPTHPTISLCGHEIFIRGLELFIRMQYFMSYNHHIYKPKILGLELFIRMQYFMAYNHLIYKPKICGLEL